jgi:hypothetical protein
MPERCKNARMTTWTVVADAQGNPFDGSCNHVDSVRNVKPSTVEGCEDCLRVGGQWVHLRECLQCGHVGCCDNSPGKHATAHFKETGHPLMQSFEPGEDWAWCYVDEYILEQA